MQAGGRAPGALVVCVRVCVSRLLRCWRASERARARVSERARARVSARQGVALDQEIFKRFRV